ncbi:hypothetical protein LBMAG42_46490 [Deltaproteobacteria bacterium]|nr:hypothetical protein LBMAG42_46490 [Deltaproteobacteria bacterium]
MIWIALACTPTNIQLGSENADSESVDSAAGTLVGDSANELLPGDTAADTGDPPPVDDPDLFAPDTIWELTLELDDDAYSELSRDGHDFVDATLGWDGRTWPVATHIKGSSSWQDISDKPSLVIDVNRLDPKQEFMGVKKFYLHNDCYDPSQMSETLSYRFYREAGYPASETSFAHLTLNGRDYGLYTVVEAHNDDFLEKWFGDPNGNLYENRDAYCDVTDLGCMEVEESDEGNDEAFIALGQAARTRAVDWRAAVEPLLNWDRFIAYLGLEIAVVHWDSYSYDLSNYSLYHDPTADEWTFFTQSMDLDYGFRPWSYPSCGQYGMTIDKYDMGMLAASCHADASCKAELVARVLEYADFLEAADGAARVAELEALIGGEVRADSRRYYSDAEYADHVACLKTFFEGRPAQLREWAAGE